MPIFTERDREQLREKLVALAQQDVRLTGAAHVGSAAAGLMDRWSDIDLALCIAPDANAKELVADWTSRFYDEYGAATHHDVRHGGTLFRVFLLKNTLQVDLSFWPANEFAPMGSAFKLIFGQANPERSVPPPAARELIGMAWLYALHARLSIARGRAWQAEYMLSGMRDHVLALACLRNGLSAYQGRGLDELPPQVKDAITECLVRSLEPEELTRAFISTMKALLTEIRNTDADLAERLTEPLTSLVERSDTN